MSRLPIPGKDAHTWGKILNDFLLQGHHADGRHKLDTDSTLTANSDQVIASQKAIKTYVDGRVSVESVGDATTTNKGKLRLQGDLAGSADAPLVKTRTSVTVGLTNSDFLYDSSMSPSHYADAVNNALAANSGEVFLRNETVTFSQAAGKVITPLSASHISGAGIDKTIIRTSRTDYVFKNTASSLLNAVLSNLTIDCQSLATVSGIDIRKFTRFIARHMKFLNSTQWFARFGNEPSASTTEISSGLAVEDCEFANHQGIYEMLLLYNLEVADVNRCVFKDKTGTPGAAPTVGIWQKAADVTIRNSLFSNLVSSAIYYAYSTHRIRIENCSFLNVGQAVRGANVSDNGKFGEKVVQGLDINGCWMIGGPNSATTDAIQIGSVDGFTISNTCIKEYAKGIRIGFGNSTPTAGGDGGDAYYPSRHGVINNVSFININGAGHATTLNSPLYFTNGGDFGQLIIRDCTVYDPDDRLDYAVIFNGGSTATAAVLAGSVSGITVTNTFAWYSAPPTVTLSGDGSGATAVAVIDNEGHLTAIQVTNGGTGYTAATVAVNGGNYKNITFINCDFGGKQIRINDNAQVDWQTVQFINCRNFDTGNLPAATVDQAVKNNTRLVAHDGKLGIGVSTLAASTDLQLGDGSAVVTMRLNNVQEKNSNDNIQKIFANFGGKTETLYKNNTNASSRRSVFDIDTGIYSANGFDANLGTDLSTGGLIAKRLTTTQRDALVNPGNGTIIYNTTTNKLQAYENGSWANLI